MKFRLLYKYLIIFLIPLSIIQPVKADLASDLLKKAQKLSEKQKIKGKKLEAFILSNIITVDYEGKEQTYKFNKDITYNVYENSKVIGDGTWTIKGLTKSSIKLSGYRDIYFQIYSSKDKISTLTNLKKKNDSQTNRKILKILSLDDFEKQLANSKTKKEKKKVVKKEEVKKEEVKKEEVKTEKKNNKDQKSEKKENFVVVHGSFKKNPNNLPLCEPADLRDVDFSKDIWHNCWGSQEWSNGISMHQCVGNCVANARFEGEWQNFKYNGLGIFYHHDQTAVSYYKDNKKIGQGLLYVGWGLEDRSKCNYYTETYVNGEVKLGKDKKDCSKDNNLHMVLFDTKFVSDEEQKLLTQIKCDNYKINTGNYSNKEKFGGYKDFYFGMKKIDALNLIECSKPSYFFNLDKDCENIVLGAEKCDHPFYGQRGVYAEGLYKFGLGVEFENEEVNKVRLDIIKEMRKERVFYMLDSGINEFENLKKSLSKKYKLLIKPSKTSLEKYNTNDYGGILHWVYQSDIKGNLILLVLDKRPIQNRFLHSGEVHYLSKELSEIYSAEIDSKTIKTDDL